MNDATLILSAAGLVVLAGFFAASDSAISTVSPARAAELAREKVRGARALQQIASDAPRYTNLLLLLRLLCELTATTLVALVVITGVQAGWLAALVTAGTMTVVSFVVVGVGPRTVGRQHAYAVGRFAAPLVLWLGRALGPLASLLIRIGNAFTPGRGFRYGPFATQVELRELVDLAEQRGVVEHDEREMIHSVFALGDTIAREVMVPRTEMVLIEERKSAGQALKLALRSGFSRLPVIGESVDDVLGVVYLKDLVQRTQTGANGLTVGEVMRAGHLRARVQARRRAAREMQAARTHMAIVVDEYGGTAGLVTIEDILEEIVGEITDEYDVERPPGPAHRRRPGPGLGPAAGRGPRRAVRRRARHRRGGDGRRPAGPGPGPGADPGRGGDRRRTAAGGRGHDRPAQPDRHGAGDPPTRPTEDADRLRSATRGRPPMPDGLVA